jgi:O-antigen/teichoic acid export membrane protein
VVLYGLTSYGFLVLAARSLGPARYASLSALWAIVYVVGPGFFLPLEQEVNRVLAARRARGEGPGRLLRRALVIAGLVVTALSIIAVAFGRAALERAFDGDRLLLLALILALIGYAIQHVVRGALAGLPRFGRYAAILSVEGTVRVGACAVIAAAGVSSAGPYGLVIAVAPFVALLPGWGAARGLAGSGSAPAWSELTTSIGYLVLSAVFAQFLAMAEPLIVKVLSPAGREAAAGRFLASLVIARIPIFLFQAVQPPLLSRLSGLASAGRLAGFRASVKRLMMGLGLVGVSTILVAVLIGPWIVTTLFGPGFDLGRSNLVYLAGGTACYLVAVGLAQALIALSLQPRIAAAWVAGSLVFVVRIALGSEIIPRVAQGFLLGSAVAAGIMAAGLAVGLRQGAGRRQAMPGAVATEP